MNARPESSSPAERTEQQAICPQSDDHEASTTDDEETRSYTCLECGRQFHSFTQQCPTCGAREFRTGTPAEGTETEETRIEAMMAHLNPYIPR